MLCAHFSDGMRFSPRKRYPLQPLAVLVLLISLGCALPDLFATPTPVSTPTPTSTPTPIPTPTPTPEPVDTGWQTTEPGLELRYLLVTEYGPAERLVAASGQPRQVLELPCERRASLRIGSRLDERARLAPAVEKDKKGYGRLRGPRPVQLDDGDPPGVDAAASTEVLDDGEHVDHGSSSVRKIR